MCWCRRLTLHASGSRLPGPGHEQVSAAAERGLATAFLHLLSADCNSPRAQAHQPGEEEHNKLLKESRFPCKVSFPEKLPPSRAAVTPGCLGALFLPILLSDFVLNYVRASSASDTVHWVNKHFIMHRVDKDFRHNKALKICF